MLFQTAPVAFEFNILLIWLLLHVQSQARATMHELPQAVISRIVWTADVYEPSDVSLAAAAAARKQRPCSVQAQVVFGS